MKRDIEGGIGLGTATLDIQHYTTAAALDIIGDGLFVCISCSWGLN
jgi:hypothetical protein